ncbi:MAG: UDP-2,3-diacylglucosamine diphosphatase LpxI, partial [Candidatus Aminicenantes bacterium]|nr:UDP-2,3-diacylglucosamine diphosphatase LpxI [Candidatus Aminicenantes bacterium]
MGKTYGMIAGSGRFPFFLLEEMAKQGDRCVVAGIKGEADQAIVETAEIFEVFSIAQIEDMIAFFHSFDIREAFFAGKIEHKQIYRKETLDSGLFLKSWVKDRSPAALIQTVIDLLAENGIEIINPSSMLLSAICKEGLLSKAEPHEAMMKDIKFGWIKAKHLADNDIGQTIIVKDLAVVAVEGMEGTDKTIQRGGELAGKGTVVVKVCRTHQDNRIDLPAVGLTTIQSLVDAESSALCIEADSMPF